MSAGFLLGVDIGAGSLKASLIDLRGTVMASASYDLETRSPHSGWTEQDPEDWYRGFCETVSRVISASDVDSAAIAAVSFSAGAHTPVLLDGDGRVLRPAILWSDQRAHRESRELKSGQGARILDEGFNVANPTWTLPQLLWVARNEPDVAARTARVFVAKDYLRYRVTGRWETDRVDALGTLLLDARKGEWSDYLVRLAGWNPETLPPIVEPDARAGEVGAAAAAASGLLAGTPVIAGSSDTAIEIFGAGVIEPGQGAVKLATAATVSVIAERPTVSEDLINYSYVVPGLWYTITGTNSCASAHKWLRDRFFGGSAGGFEEMDRLAQAVPPGAEGLVFHPYLNGERSPYWDPLLRADFIGMTMRHDRGHFVRALYEGIACSVRDCFEVFKDKGMGFETARLVGGGAKSRLWRQIVADVLGCEIEVPEVGDASFGAAMLAGIGIGAFADARDATRRCVRIGDRYLPDPARGAHYDRQFEIYKASQARLADICHELHKLETTGDAGAGMQEAKAKLGGGHG